MRAMELSMMYLLVGAGLGAAWRRSEGRGGWLEGVLWPLFLPGLLARMGADRAEQRPVVGDPGRVAAVQAAVARVRGALGRWGGLPSSVDGGALCAALARGLLDQVERLGEVDAVLADQTRASAQVLARLQGLRTRLDAQLSARLVDLDDLAARVELARLGDQEGEGVGQRLAQLAALVEGVAEVHQAARRAR